MLLNYGIDVPMTNAMPQYTSVLKIPATRPRCVCSAKKLKRG